MQDFFYNGIWRMDWGLGNPNKTAALIASLMIAVWALAYLTRFGGRRWGFWVALTLFTGLGVCLIHTYSRGGLIALFVGLVPVVWFAPRPWSWVRIGAVVASIWIIIGTSVYLDAYTRYGQGVVKEDRSITNRLHIWKAVPAMIMDAPEGWGIGNSGAAFMQWYQPLDKNEEYRTLVNSHLTWLVEFGWPLRIAYILAWCSALLLCWPQGQSGLLRLPSQAGEQAKESVPEQESAAAGQRWLAVPFGVVLCFAVSAWFSSVAEEPWLWAPPILALVGALFSRLLTREWPPVKYWLMPPAVALATFVVIFVLAGNTGINKRGETIIVGKAAAPNTWVLVDPKILGSRYGRTLRTYLSATEASAIANKATVEPFETIGFALSPRALPDLTGKRLIVCGKLSEGAEAARLIAAAKEVVWANPGLFPQEVTLTADQSAKLRIVIGEFSQSPASTAWAGQSTSVRRLPGVGDFVPSWPEKLLIVQQP